VQVISKIFPMFDLSLEGLNLAVKKLVTRL
jgi:hypothetical protein